MPASHNSNHSANFSASESATQHRADRGVAGRNVAGNIDSESSRTSERTDVANPEQQSTAEADEATVIEHPASERESQGAQRVVLAELPSDLPLTHRPAVALQCAQEAFAQTGYWVAFYRAILGAEGVVNRLFPSVDDLDFFYTTEEFAEIQKILTALRASDTEKADAIEPLKMITIRIPRSMQAALISESKRHSTSINKLCISKLLRPIEAELVPHEKGQVKGRKPKA